ncbi:MAG: DNA primase [Crocinitomicaceae bacterium]|jgi:DNA primase
MKNTDIIKDKLNIVDVVGSYVKLEKAGKTYKGKSPFTNEKTPSFFVSPEKGFFYCFSSGKGGDIFTFVQEIERIEFHDALKLLAEKAGIKLESNAISLEKHNETTIRFKVLDDITKWYEINLRKNTEVVEHLLKRGLTKETIIKFRLGFSLDAWRECYEYLHSRKYRDQDIESVGLIIKKEGSGYYDRFRSRIMFPLMDGRGRVVGFSGRIFTDDPDTQGAKYINSPEGPLFDKSEVLYGYHTAKTSMSKEDACILVEGQFDVVMAQQAGYIHTVAISGTGLTDHHINMIKRFTDNIFLALDSDKAGVKATRRSVLAAYRHGMQVKIIMMLDGMDPADTIVHSKEQWDLCVHDSKDYIDYRLELFNRVDHTFEEKKKLVDTDLFTFVYLMKSSMVQDRVLQKLALFLGVSIEAVRNDFTSFKPDQDDIIKSDNHFVYTKNVSPISERDIKREVALITHFTKDQDYEIELEIQAQIEALYSELYDEELKTTIAELPETEKNMQLFILQDKYKDTSEKSFGSMLLTMLAEEKIRRLDNRSAQLLEETRQTESKADGEKLAELTVELQKILLLKKDLKNLIQK